VTAFFDLETFFSQTRERVDAALREWLPAVGKDDHLRLREAITAALLEGGKRLRPCLVVAACQAVGGDVERALGPACAAEMIHAYSLVHDDLPAMDNDAVRRGKPTCHKRFGETAAILVGDALLTLSFEVAAASANQQGLKIVYELARAAGARGMVGGQAMDMAMKKSVPSFEHLELCHSGKTAALFSACAAIGALVADASEAAVAQLRSCGFDLGLAFQHADDLEDADFTAHRERAWRRAVDLSQRAARAAERFGADGAALSALARWVEERATRAKTPDGSATQS
jgi:geranylgeranyl pyrophosphate synthase